MPIVTITDAKGQKHQINSHKIISRKAVYGLYLKNGKLLMVKDKVSNNWEFPGGGIENNESFLKALKREFLEETGLVILDNKISLNKIIYSCEELFFDINSNQTWKTKRNFFLISQVKGLINKQGNKDDIIKARFFSLSHLPFSQVSQTVRQVLNKLLRRYKNNIQTQY